MKPILLFALFLSWQWYGCAASGSADVQTWEQKVDPRLRAEILDFKATGAAPQNFPVLIKFKTPPTAEQLSALEQANIRLQSQTGDLATAVLSLPAISELAKKDYVIYLEASKDRTLKTE